MKTFFISLLLMLVIQSCAKQEPYQCMSPNKTITVDINPENGLQYAVIFNSDTVVNYSNIELTLSKIGQLNKYKIIDVSKQTVKKEWERTWGKTKRVEDNFNELKLELQDLESKVLIDLYIRAYNDGVALRYGFPKQDKLKEVELEKEELQFNFTENHKIWMADYEKHISSQESEFHEKKISDITTKNVIGMPLLVKTNTAFVTITEANLTDWSGAFLRKTDTIANAIVTELVPRHDDSLIVVKRKTPAISPWRVMMLANKPGDLIGSNIIANLNEPVAFNDVSWIQPGVSAWDWWWSNKYAPSVDFELGANQETMMYFIDFAAEMGWEYQIVDWKWYGDPFLNNDYEQVNPDVDITTCNDNIDIKALVQYAKSKNVKLILWLHWWHLERQMDEALALYEQWGASGIKIDFMNRQDQEMVNFYHTVAKKAGKHKLLVNFHGAYKPTGVSRKYPNLITREGVLGNENTKWSKRITPEHNVTLPFTRGLLGEMDYTPVAFRNATPNNFKQEWESKDQSPMVQSTRCHQLAMTVVYESALGVFCDSPDNYRKGIGLEFLKQVPTTWDETKVLKAAVGDYIVIARRKDNKWFIGGMTDSKERQLSFNLEFLDNEPYTATIWQDAADASIKPMNAERKTLNLSRKDVLNINLASGGGFVVILKVRDSN